MSLRRKQPKRIKNVAQSGPVKGVRLSLEAAENLQGIMAMYDRLYNKAEHPSISLLINKAICRWADDIGFDEDRLAQAHKELLAESSPRTNPTLHHYGTSSRGDFDTDLRL